MPDLDLSRELDTAIAAAHRAAQDGIVMTERPLRGDDALARAGRLARVRWVWIALALAGCGTNGEGGEPESDAGPSDVTPADAADAANDADDDGICGDVVGE